ncbi:MAG: dihydroorotase [Bacteroidales bacterium]|nr:dihydroorotase [Bacteroidales bacterium]MBQ6101409.1 dihydroorotase [Bacteroidales bacterium]
MNYWIKNATLVNEGQAYVASVFVSDGKIAKIVGDAESFDAGGATVIDATGKYLIPGIIDEHVHFREPGLTQKADIYTESRAAVAGGVTSFMDMPNTNPQTTTQELLQQKFDLAAEKSLANYSFYLGATNDNLSEVVKTDPRKVCGIKLFMGSSTGNMLVDKNEVLVRLFRESPCLIATHCEDEATIYANTVRCKDLAAKGEVIADASIHPFVRTMEACYKSSSKAVDMAEKFGARLHVMHISTKQELSLFRNDIPLKDKKITAETCPHYLWFDDRDYEAKSFAIKCNPAIKSHRDREALLQALHNGLIDTIGTDHAPHLLEEKMTGDYFTSKSGFPSIQHSLQVVLEATRNEEFDMPLIVQLMCHNPAVLYQIDRRGFIREGYYADLALADLNHQGMITNEAEFSKCGWTPYNGLEVHAQVTHTFVNGNLVYENGTFHEEHKGERLLFNRMA